MSERGFAARVDRGKAPGRPCLATVNMHPYEMPLGERMSIKALEWSLERYQSALKALRDAGVPDDALITFRDHRGFFGDRGNARIEALRADWTEGVGEA